MDKSKYSKIPPLRYDKDRINEDIPITDVIRMYAGDDPNLRRNGNIHCPSPEHTDKTPSAKIYREDNICKCFSCGRRLTPVNLAGEFFPNLKFGELLEKMCDDFGLSRYSYSNLAEVEAAKQGISQNKFVDIFPLNADEIEAIGLYNDTKQVEITYAVKATEYFTALYGEIPPNAQTHNKDGKEILIDATRREAEEIGLLSYSGNEHDYIKAPTLQEVWKDDKKGVEEMLRAKAFDKLLDLNNIADGLQVEISEYKATHSTNDIKEADKLRSSWLNYMAKGVEIKLKPEQREKIEGLYDFESMKNTLSAVNQEYASVQKIYQKVVDRIKERADYDKKQTQKKNWEQSR